MSFSLEYGRQPRKFLKKYDKHIVKRLLTKIRETLSNNPVSHDAKSMVNAHGVFRIRIGDFRVLYSVSYQDNEIIVIKIEKRERAYD